MHRYLTFLLIICIMICALPVSAQTVKELTDEEFSSEFRQDVRLLNQYTGQLRSILETIDAEDKLFDRERTEDFTIPEKERLYSIWAEYIDYMIAIEKLNAKYQDFYLITDRPRHSREFLLAYASYIGKLSAGYHFVSKTIGNDLYEKKLDDAHPSLGIPRGMYASLKWNTIHVMDVSSAMTGRAYMKVLGGTFQEEGLISSAETAWIFPYIDEQYTYVKKQLNEDGIEYFSSNGLDILRDGFLKTWFPVQKNVAIWMGETKVKRKGRYLITEDQIHTMDTHLEPGDIILTRRNWHLSNIGLPGFWPHAELYIGTPEDMSAYFDTEEVNAYFQSRGDFTGLMDYLKKTFPAGMSRYRASAHDGKAHQIIEAIAEGVTFSSLEKATVADYVVALRPRLSKVEKARAIVQAFTYLGRPYDFDFDFLTDSTIVCSELIYKAYLPAEGKKGLSFTLHEMAGRKVLPPNNIARKFDLEYGTPARELDFVYFLDGSEADQKATVKTVEIFRGTHERPKWDIAQK